jgi:hypothetical protein
MPTIGCPLSGETADANNAGDTGIEELFIQPVTNALTYLGNKIPGAEMAAYPGRKYVDFSSVTPHVMSSGGTEWLLDWTSGGTSYYAKWMVSQASGNTVPFLVEITSMLPSCGKIAAFGAILEGGSARTELPASMPSVVLIRNDIMTINVGSTIIDTATDSSASIEDYKAIHGIMETGLTIDISPSGTRKRWFLGVFGATAPDLADRVGLLFFDTTE